MQYRQPATGFKQDNWSTGKGGTKGETNTQLRSQAPLDLSFAEAQGDEVAPLRQSGVFSECFSLYSPMQQKKVEPGNSTETADTYGWLHSCYPRQACPQEQLLVPTVGWAPTLAVLSSSWKSGREAPNDFQFVSRCTKCSSPRARLDSHLLQVRFGWFCDTGFRSAASTSLSEKSLLTSEELLKAAVTSTPRELTHHRGCNFLNHFWPKYSPF